MQDNYDNHPLDLSYLTEMVGHNPEFMIEVFDMFIEQTPFYMAELENALSAENWDGVGDCAHKIKPTFSYIGRSDIKEFVQTIEHNARNKLSLEQIPTDINRLSEMLDRVYVQIDEMKKSISPEN